jgi:FMN phosphatase YigB (HAD superfamily)
MVDTLRHLSKAHDLILVSNIWSKKGIWVDHLGRVGVLNLFKETVFSSDHRCIKPGHRIYEIALGLTQVPLREIVFIGDDPVCDVSTPKALGMATIHVVGTGESNRHDADRVVKRLSDLIT